MPEPAASDVAQPIAALKRIPQVDWPGGYAEAGLCVLDAVWSPGANYQRHVRPVVERYKRWRPTAGQDNAADLIAAIDSAGGPERFAADIVRNRQRTSTRNGIFKSEAVRSAAAALVRTGIPTTSALRHASRDQLEGARVQWCAVRGQGSGIAWRYLLMLSGIEEVKPDRMVRRFLASVLGRDLSPDEAVALVTAAAIQLGWTATLADHRIWSYESKLASEQELREAAVLLAS